MKRAAWDAAEQTEAQTDDDAPEETSARRTTTGAKKGHLKRKRPRKSKEPSKAAKAHAEAIRSDTLPDDVLYEALKNASATATTSSDTLYEQRNAVEQEHEDTSDAILLDETQTDEDSVNAELGEQVGTTPGGISLVRSKRTPLGSAASTRSSASAFARERMGRWHRSHSMLRPAGELAPGLNFAGASSA